MNPLEELHSKIDTSDWDTRHYNEINKAFQEVNGVLEKAKEMELLHKSDIERQVFSLNKSAEQGITSRMNGTRKLENGEEVPFEWPDISAFSDEDFAYINERFHNCKNIFAKSEYGLVIFYKGKLSREDCKELFDILLELAKKYYNANKGQDKPPYYNWTFYNALANALHISYFKRFVPGFTDKLKIGLKYAEQIHKEWKESGPHMLRTVIDMTGLVLKYYNFAKNIIDIDGFYKRNIEASEEINKTYTWGAIYIIDENIRISKESGTDTSPMILRKAHLYEKLAAEAENTPRQLAAISFIETALRLYEELEDDKNIRRLEIKYKDIRGTGHFTEIKEPLPIEEVKRIQQIIQKEIEEKDSFGILQNFVWCPMYPNIDTIAKDAEEWKKQSVLLYMFGGSIADKFGNTVAKYPSQSDEWAFWQSYSFSFQIGTQTLVSYFLSAIKSGKLNVESTIDFLSRTWINEPLKRNYNQDEVEIIPLDLVKPPIEYFFNEIENWFSNPKKLPNLIVIIDSLVLKIESLLRYFCDKFEPKIQTFKQKDNGIVIERNLDEIIGSLEHKPDDSPPQITNFSEDDRKFIKFALSEKVGENLRHRIAHGLLDAEEYSIEKAILIFTIIMRLSKYQFKKI